MGHLCVAGVVGREGSVRSSELAGRLGAQMASGDNLGVRNLGSTTRLSARLSIAPHSPRQGSVGETERSDSDMTVVSKRWVREGRTYRWEWGRGQESGEVDPQQVAMRGYERKSIRE